ncbi:BglG family transcription antiterminator [Lacticaseibacillus hegangensis]|uniref:BglG family transcription antiterminator n=1 Tax=Lacticaseibacillus hegangensis TaxID=2486010 RepID=A0ABW4CZF5_9LACO|nr:PTS sugar transporter subunit IIA [Lacticaseibacillus hegangensis]
MSKNLDQDILRILMRTDAYLTLKNISETLKVSKKTVWNHIHSSRFHDLLGGLNLEAEPRKGIRVIGDNSTSRLREILADEEDVLSVSDKDRLEQILTYLCFRQVCSISDLSQRFLMSSYEICGLIYKSDIYLLELNLQIQSTRGVGIRIAGAEEKIRQLFVRLVLSQTKRVKTKQHQNPDFDEGILEVLKQFGYDKEFVLTSSIVKQIERKDFVGFNDEGRKEIVLSTLISSHRSQMGEKVTVPPQSVEIENPHYQDFANTLKANFNLKPDDVGFLWDICATREIHTPDSPQGEDINIVETSKALVTTFFDVDIHDSEIQYLIQNLAYHLSQAVRRSRLGIQVHNPALNDIKMHYGQFYYMAMTAVEVIEKRYNIALNNDEIGYIAQYICVITQILASKQFYKVVLVSDNGYAFNQIFVMKLMNAFHNLMIEKTILTKSVISYDFSQCDMIVSFTPLKLKSEQRAKYVHVSAALTEEDRQTIQHLLFKNRSGLGTDSKELEENVDFEYREGNFSSREELLRLNTNELLARGVTKERYLQSIIKRESKASTAIGRGIAIPHGDSSLVKIPTLLFIKNRTPIVWGDEMVDTVIMLVLNFDDTKNNKLFFRRLYSCISDSSLIRGIRNQQSIEVLRKKLMEGESS